MFQRKSVSNPDATPQRERQAATHVASAQRSEPAFARAVHLAGHAVAAVVCGGTYGPLALDGGTGVCAAALAAGAGGGGPARNATEAAIIVALAGGEAEAIVTGVTPSACTDVTRWLTDGDPAEAEPYVEWLRLKAARAVAHPLRQRLIQALAERLLLGPLTASEIARLTNLETSRYMRGQ